jgi:hypothetical protein
MAGVLLFALLATWQNLVADMSKLVSVERLAGVGVVLAACRRIVLPADVVLLLLLASLLLVEVDEGARPLTLPRGPGVGQLICGEERQFILPVEGVSVKKNFKL